MQKIESQGKTTCKFFGFVQVLADGVAPLLAMSGGRRWNFLWRYQDIQTSWASWNHVTRVEQDAKGPMRSIWRVRNVWVPLYMGVITGCSQFSYRMTGKPGQQPGSGSPRTSQTHTGIMQAIEVWLVLQPRFGSSSHQRPSSCWSWWPGSYNVLVLLGSTKTSSSAVSALKQLRRTSEPSRKHAWRSQAGSQRQVDDKGRSSAAQAACGEGQASVNTSINGACKDHSFAGARKELSLGALLFRAEVITHCPKQLQDPYLQVCKKILATRHGGERSAGELELLALARIYDVKVVIIPKTAGWFPVVALRKKNTKCIALGLMVVAWTSLRLKLPSLLASEQVEVRVHCLDWILKLVFPKQWQDSKLLFRLPMKRNMWPQGRRELRET